MGRLYAVVRTRGPAYDFDKPLEAQRDWEAHAACMDRLVAEGFILLGGPLEDGKDVLMVVRAEDEREVERRLAEDPWPEAMLATTRIAPWRLRLGRLPGA